MGASAQCWGPCAKTLAIPDGWEKHTDPSSGKLCWIDRSREIHLVLPDLKYGAEGIRNLRVDCNKLGLKPTTNGWGGCHECGPRSANHPRPCHQYVVHTSPSPHRDGRDDETYCSNHYRACPECKEVKSCLKRPSAAKTAGEPGFDGKAKKCKICTKHRRRLALLERLYSM